MQQSAQFPAGSPSTRLDVYLHSLLPSQSRAAIQRLIREHHVLLDGAPAKPGATLKPGNRIDWDDVEPTPPITAAEPQDIPLDFLFRDEAIAVINKQAGMVTHPGAGNWDGTLVNALLHHAGNIESGSDALRPGIVHRLDKETSGCLVVALTPTAHANLSTQFAGRTVVKEYLAITVRPPTPPKGSIRAAIARHPVHRTRMSVVPDESGRHAHTEYETVETLGGLALVRCRLHTGRTHQIRVHLKHIGTPIAGDPVYGNRGSFQRHMLHAWRLALDHPSTGKRLAFEAPIPSEFEALGFAAPRGE